MAWPQHTLLEAGSTCREQASSSAQEEFSVSPTSRFLTEAQSAVSYQWGVLGPLSSCQSSAESSPTAISYATLTFS